MTAFIAIPKDAAERVALLTNRRFHPAEFYIIGNPGDTIDGLAKILPRTVTRIETPDGEWTQPAPPSLPEPTPAAPVPVKPFCSPRDDIAAVTCFFNPAGFSTLRRNYDVFRAGCEAAGVPLWTVELAIGDTPHTITGENVVHVRGADVIFSKENLLNIGFSRVPRQFDKLAFVDCDLVWDRPDWLWQASELLEKHGAVQLFGHIHHTDAQGRPAHNGPSMARKHLEKLPGWGAPGGAWAVHRQMLDLSVGLYDRCVVGAGDMVHSHLGFRGRFDDPWANDLNPAMRQHAIDWARMVWRYVRGDLACVDATVTHLWHGDRSDRQYQTRSMILADADPETWFCYSHEGVLGFTPQAPPSIRLALIEYFKARNEDRPK